MKRSTGYAGAIQQDGTWQITSDGKPICTGLMRDEARKVVQRLIREQAEANREGRRELANRLRHKYYDSPRWLEVRKIIDGLLTTDWETFAILGQDWDEAAQ